MKASFFKFAVFVIAFSFAAISQENRVTITGKAGIIAGNMNAAKNNALIDAYRQAVEKGIGVWMKSQTQIENFMTVKDEILTRSEGYVTNHTILKEGPDEGGLYAVTIEATVNISKIGSDFRQLVGRVKTEMGNPSITFVLTTYENVGAAKHSSEAGYANISQQQNAQVNTQQNLSNSGQASAASQNSGNYSGASQQNTSATYSGQATQNTYSGNISGASSGSGQYSGSSAAQGNYSQNTQSGYSGSTNSDMSSSTKYDKSQTIAQFDESLWKKLSDATIIDAFQQEFKEKGFDLMATDKARQIALAPSNVQTNINPFDREGVRLLSEKEGANFVARGEAMIIDKSQSSGMRKATVKLGAEIIDVNSGDIVASYSNTESAISSDDQTAMAQAIKKTAILGARTLADQTITTWRERAANGKQYTIILQGIKSIRSQQNPFVTAVQSNVTKIINSTTPEQGILLMRVLYRGDKGELGNAILNYLDPKPGFEEGKFDGPSLEGGNIVFKFL